MHDASDGERSAMSTAPILSVRNLSVQFSTERGTVRAVNGVDLDVTAGSTLAVVGESGSGKSVTAQSLLGLIECPPGSVSIDGMTIRDRHLTRLTGKEVRGLRGTEIAMVFQDAATSMNPRFRVGYQIAEGLRFRLGLSRQEAQSRAIELMERVRIPAAEARYKNYPHQFSGGMLQRAMIATAISLKPSVLIADEPTTALDVTVQAQIMELIDELKVRDDLGVILITHDLGVVGESAETVAVMYAGRIVESGEVGEIFSTPAHPYTRALLASVPSLKGTVRRMPNIPGAPPDLSNIPSGCAFHPRCEFASEICTVERPEFGQISPGSETQHRVACHHYEKVLSSQLPHRGDS